MRFEQTEEGQEQAREIMGAIREGYLDRLNGKPLFEDKNGKPVYRILLSGLKPWVKYAPCAYSAQDGPRRQFNVGRESNRTWGAVLHDGDSVVIIAEGLPTMRDARDVATEYARRLPWVEGAPR